MYEEQTEPITHAGKANLIFFYTSDRGRNADVEMWLEELKLEYPSRISVKHMDVLTREGWDEFKGYGLTVTPAVVINRTHRLQFKDLTKESLSELIRRILGKVPFHIM